MTHRPGALATSACVSLAVSAPPGRAALGPALLSSSPRALRLGLTRVGPFFRRLCAPRRWDSCGGDEPWEGAAVEAVQIDRWGRFPYLVFRLAEGRRQRLLVRGSNSCGAEALAHAVEEQASPRARDPRDSRAPALGPPAGAPEGFGAARAPWPPPCRAGVLRAPTHVHGAGMLGAGGTKRPPPPPPAQVATAFSCRCHGRPRVQLAGGGIMEWRQDTERHLRLLPAPLDDCSSGPPSPAATATQPAR